LVLVNPEKKKMKTAFVISVSPTSFEAVTPTGDVGAALGMAAKEGFNGVEVAVRDPALVSGKEIRRLAREHGLAIAAIGTGQAYLAEGLSLTAADAKVRAAAMARVKRQLELGCELDARVIIGLIRGTVAKKEEVPAALTVLAEGLAELGEYAREVRAPGLLVEPINRYETRLINSVVEGTDFLDRLNDPSLMILADTFHMNIEDRDLNEAIHLAGVRLGHVHFADSNRWAPGQGHTDFEPVFAALEAIKYQDWLSAEIMPEPTPEEAMRLTAEFFRGRGVR
jgi:5-keto-L-gluconate epimerase